MVAQVTNKIPDELVMVFGDAHIYKNHIEQVNEQISRKDNLFEFPKLQINKSIDDINNFTMSDFNIIDYKCHPTIKAPMAV